MINAGSDHNSLVKAIAFYNSESMKTNKLTYFVINHDTDVAVDSLVTDIKAYN